MRTLPVEPAMTVKKVSGIYKSINSRNVYLIVNDPDPEVCDARDDATYSEAGKKIVFKLFSHFSINAGSLLRPVKETLKL